MNTLICDLQFGSTGKGLIAGKIAEDEGPDTVMAAWSANAGHTYIDRAGRKFIHSMLPNGVVSPNLKRVMLGPGSLLDLDGLAREITQCRDLLDGAMIYIHENAAVITQEHRDLEAQTMKAIGSTCKGVGEALKAKIARSTTRTVTINQHSLDIGCLGNRGFWTMPDPFRIVNNGRWQELIQESKSILVEGAQGYSLGINSGFYPYTTSRECTPDQICSDCGIPRPMIDRVIGTARTYPIRVANRYDDEGMMIGTSGPGYADQQETTFEAIGVATEKTTVTRLPRRVFTFSEEQIHQALWHCRPDEVFLNFCNYVQDPRELQDILWNFSTGPYSVPPTHFGYGPTYHDIHPEPLHDY